jgi:signal transduction histidine kinase
MEPAVPFALVGVVQLFAVAAWIALAGAGCFPRLRRTVTPVFVAGALLLASAEALTAVSFGTVASAAPMWLRTAGFVLLGAGLARDALRAGVPAAGLSGVAVPLGAPAAPSLVAGVAGLLSAGAAVRARGHVRGTRSALFAGLVLAAGAAALGTAARTSAAATLAVLAARAASVAAILVVLVLLARTSVLGKVVTAILAGIVVMAVAAVGVVGTAVTGAVQGEQARQLRDVAVGQRQALRALGSTQATVFAQVAAQCARSRLGVCAQTLTYYAAEPHIFAARVDRGGKLVVITKGAHLAPAARQALPGQPLVRSVLAGGAAASAVTVLPDRPPVVALLGAAPVPACAPNSSSFCRKPGQRTPYVAVYGIRLGHAYADSVHRRISLGYSLLADGQVLASSLPEKDRHRLARAARHAGVFGKPLPDRSGAGVEAVGRAPEVRFLPLSAGNSDDAQVATLAISRPAADALAAQRALQRRLFVAALAVLVVVAAFALLLGDRLVDPVRRLTVAAGRIRRGELTASGGVGARDEVGALSRAFDAMTAALRAQAAREREVERMKTEFLANVSHELRTPLTPIRGYAELLRDRSRLRPEQAAEFADTIVAASARMGRIVDLLVDVAALEAGRVRPAPRPTAVGGYVDGRLAAWRARWPDRAGDFARRVSAGLPDLAIDPEWIAKALDELADNAVKYTAPGTRITLTAALAPPKEADAAGSAAPSRRSAAAARASARAGDSVAAAPTVETASRAEGNGGRKAGRPAVSRVGGMPGEQSAHNTRVRVAVHDAGGGLPADELALLTGDFTQADASATRRAGGMGLGLSFVGRLAERFEVTFVASAAVGRGATFGLDLPAAVDSVPADSSPGGRCRRTRRTRRSRARPSRR